MFVYLAVMFLQNYLDQGNVSNAVDKIVNIGGIPYRAIGVLKSKGFKCFTAGR